MKGLLTGAGMLLTISGASAADLWSIEWTSDMMPCHSSVADGLHGPVIGSLYPACMFDVYRVSICPKNVTNKSWPYENGKPITVVGYSLVMILTDAHSQGIMEVGSGHGDGPDVFAMTAGVGSNSQAGSFAPNGFPQGASEASHFDVYASCDGTGQWQGLVRIYYSLRRSAGDEY